MPIYYQFYFFELHLQLIWYPQLQEFYLVEQLHLPNMLPYFVVLLQVESLEYSVLRESIPLCTSVKQDFILNTPSSKEEIGEEASDARVSKSFV